MTEILGKDTIYHSCCNCGCFVQERPEGGYNKIKTWVQGGIILKTICNACLEKWIIGEIKGYYLQGLKNPSRNLRF
ncbi:hypothetical protein [Candidatus Nitrosotenuis aquarius]|uniref:hypothetical protein n=1 Tax=Candidatus Nitrosotenuis aquarius TaxID=1846278 RepID=UPI000C1E643F|nr:hypothetical protein [Candidatus Nitrosotenuis aquarius]